MHIFIHLLYFFTKHVHIIVQKMLICENALHNKPKIHSI